jgi:rSAM/selenodomain-associated transferase 2
MARVALAPVNDDSLQRRVASSTRPVLVLFTSTGCTPCELQARCLSALAAELRGEIDIVCCLVDTAPVAVAAYEVTVTPTLILFEHGRPLDVHCGVWPLPTIRAWLDVLLPSASVSRSSSAAPAAPDSARTPISLIMPVLNEERQIHDQLSGLDAIDGIHEIIVVDGGSTDRTAELVRQFPNVRFARASRGRATQMNAGARIATGHVLLFLHADVRLPLDASKLILSVLTDPNSVAGAFRTCTIADGRRSWLGPFLHLADLRSRYTKLPYGDQAMFVRADVFWDVGGFPEQPLMEDLELSRRLSRVGEIKTLPISVRVSGRRFLARPIYYATLDNLMPFLYRAGVSPTRLAALYGDPR